VLKAIIWSIAYCVISVKRCEIGCKLVLFTNRKSNIGVGRLDWYRNQWPWMTFNGVLTAVSAADEFLVLKWNYMNMQISI